jgi:hypothetical protein
MRNMSLIAAAIVALACGCKSAPPTDTKQPAESKPVQLGTFTCQGPASCVDSTDHFDATVAAVHVTFNTADLPKAGDRYAIQWIATDVGSAAPANTVIATVDEPVASVVAGATSYTVDNNLTKPTNGWPVGQYRVEIKLGDKLVTTAKFAIQ